MKIKEDFILRRVADVWTVLPLAANVLDFDGMLTLNDSGALLWNALSNGSDAKGLVDALLNEYDVSYEQASKDVDEFIEKLKSINCLAED